MIKDLHLKNAQSHVDNKITFKPGINIITGPTDAGKSAIVRSLKWVVLNKPAGDNLRRHGTKSTTVKLDGVTKKKSSAAHTYKLGDSTFKALRSDVPIEIEKHFNLGEENFQEQHDPYFLIRDSPGQVAKTLNKVADLTIIDQARDAIKHRVKERKSEEKFLVGEIASTEEDINELDWAKQMDKDLLLAEQSQAEADSIEIDNLKKLIDDVEFYTAEFEKYPDTKGDIATLISLEKELDIDIESLKTLIKDVEDNEVKIPDPTADIALAEELIKDLQVDTTSLSTLIGKFEDADKDVKGLPDTTKDLETLLNLESEVLVANKELQLLEEKICEYEIAEDCLDHAEEVLREGKERYDEFMEKIGACPLCGGELK